MLKCRIFSTNISLLKIDSSNGQDRLISTSSNDHPQPFILQLPICGPITKQQMEICTKSEQFQQIPQGRQIQNGGTRNDPDFPINMGVGDIHRLQGRLLPHTIQNHARKYLRFHVQDKTYQFKALPLCLSTAPLEFTVVTKEAKLMAFQKGISILHNWLVWARSHQICLQHTQTLVAFVRTWVG